jgi:hypothetical protein
MPYRLRMSAEIGDWIAELRSSPPGSPESLTATEVAAALAAAMSVADPGALAMITDLAGQARPADDEDLRAAVDYMYQALLEELQRLRHMVADAGAFRSTTRHRFTPAGSEPLPFTVTEIAASEKRERALKQRAQRWQSAVDRFRTMKEVAKARITAAEGIRRVHQVLLAAAMPADGDPAEVERAAADLAAAEASLPAAQAQAAAVLAEGKRLLLAIRSDVRAIQADDGSRLDDGSAAADGGSSPDEGSSAESSAADQADGAADTADDSGAGPGVAPGLLELRADPLGADVRILCAVEPLDTLTLLAVLEGKDVIDAHRDRAIRLASDLLAEMRAEAVLEDESPTLAHDTAASELTFTDAATFLARLFPDSGGHVARRAADLTAGSTLRELRRHSGLSIDDLRQRTGMQAEELWALETSGLRSARLSDVAAYVRALGATLTLQTDGGTVLIG